MTGRDLVRAARAPAIATALGLMAMASVVSAQSVEGVPVVTAPTRFVDGHLPDPGAFTDDVMFRRWAFAILDEALERGGAARFTRNHPGDLPAARVRFTMELPTEAVAEAARQEAWTAIRSGYPRTVIRFDDVPTVSPAEVNTPEMKALSAAAPGFVATGAAWLAPWPAVSAASDPQVVVTTAVSRVLYQGWSATRSQQGGSAGAVTSASWTLRKGLARLTCTRDTSVAADPFRYHLVLEEVPPIGDPTERWSADHDLASTVGFYSVFLDPAGRLARFPEFDAALRAIWGATRTDTRRRAFERLYPD